MKNMVWWWHGAIGTIPAGWSLCNGLNGTPNLIGRFVIGAGSTYNPGDTGPALPFHIHSFTGDGHDHDIIGTDELDAGTDLARELDSRNVTGNTFIAGLPPFYALYPIMKLP